MTKKRFTALVEETPKGGAVVRLPFGPGAVWGSKPRHRVSGTIDGRKIRAIIANDDPVLMLTPMWRKDSGVAIGKRAAIELWPEGPVRQNAAMPSGALTRPETSSGDGARS